MEPKVEPVMRMVSVPVAESVVVAGIVAVVIVMGVGWQRAYRGRCGGARSFMHPYEEDLIDENRKGSGETPGTKDLFHTLRPRAKDFCLVSGHISYSNLAGRHADCA